MEYVYGAMWLVVALLLFFKFGKESKIFYVLGSFFALMGIWFFANALTPEINLFDGTFGLIFKIITGIILVITCVFYYKTYYKKGGKN